MTITAALETIADKLDLIVSMLSSNKNTKSIDRNQTSFGDFAEYYFDKFRWQQVSGDTRRSDISRYKNHVVPALGEMIISDIMPEHVQNIMDGLTEHQKTAHEVFTLINVIMKAAIKHNIIVHNPCDIVLLQSYESEHGVALTKDEERQLLAATSGTPYQRMFAVILYTGLRPNEYRTAKFDGSFIVAKNSKQKDRREHKKKIPITPMLLPYVSDMTADEIRQFKFYNVNRLREKFKSILPDHKLYDTRTTFYTRCKMCGVAPPARTAFMGHSADNDELEPHSSNKVDRAYTDLPDEYLLQEGQKFVY